MATNLLKYILIILGVLLLGFVLIQVIPYGRSHTNPPVVQEPQWDSPQTRALAQRACFDCHSNETVWPWYSNIAPFSWLLERDVVEGRQRLNFSEWSASSVSGSGGERRQRRPDEISEVVAEGQMPPATYLITHPNASLTSSEKEQLIQGLNATFGVK